MVISAYSFQEIRVTRWGITLFKISARRQAEWATDLVQHNGLSEPQAIAALNSIADKIRNI